MPIELPARETLPSIIRRALAVPREAALLERVDGDWKATSSARLLERVEALACAIRDAGLREGDRVALISPNRVDWIAVDFATFFAGCVVVPVYPTQALDQVRFILENSQAKLLFVDTPAAAGRLRSIGELPPVVVFDAPGDGGLAAFEAHGELLRAQNPQWPALWEHALRPDDLAILIYTSGTTGEPKGVMLTHDNLGFTARSSFSYAFSGVPPGAPVLSVLPFSHIYEHCILYGYLIAQASLYICHSADDLPADLRAVRPLVMTAVPRIFERVLAGIASKVRLHGGLQAVLVPWALATGRAFADARRLGRRASPALRLQYLLARALVLKKLRRMLGLDRLAFFVSGSAPLHVDIAMTFLGLGVPIVEGYGPTECSPVITVNRPQENRYATVGRPIPGVEVRLAEDGEVLAKGRNVMRGYYRDDAATAAVLQDGWYRTGDVGEFDADGYLRITDRKKELFKTSGGKFVAPARVESAIKRSPYVNQVLLVGYARPHPAALVSPNWELVRTQLHLPPNAPPEELAERSDVREFLTAQVNAQTADLATYEQVRRIVVLPHEMTVESGELSPTLKVKRRVVERRYAAEIERAYRTDFRTSAPV